jgi:hypothetical protein
MNGLGTSETTTREHRDDALGSAALGGLILDVDLDRLRDHWSAGSRISGADRRISSGNHLPAERNDRSRESCGMGVKLSHCQRDPNSCNYAKDQ